GGHEICGFDYPDIELPDDLKSQEKLKIYEGDLRDDKIVNEVINECKPDAIFHLAAQSSVKVSFENPQETFSVNLFGTLNLLEAVSKLEYEIKTLVISSSEVYGQLDPEECPVDEGHPLRPVNPYAVSKAAVDLMAYQYFKAYNSPIYVARAFSHSGPGQKTVGVLSDWAFQIAKMELGLSPPVLKVGNLKVKRDYTDVRDVVRAYMDIIEKGKPGKPYNVCSGKGYTLSDLLKKYRSMAGKDIEVMKDQSRMRPVDIPILIGSNNRIKEDTGWEPEIEIETTLSDSLKFWHDHLAEEI
ncbi:MAG: GDP-mannose 4,6-dehydratase, partial [Candidatus Zixiibacteriota bacterium]